jgi:hypothetical protein
VPPDYRDGTGPCSHRRVLFDGFVRPELEPVRDNHKGNHGVQQQHAAHRCQPVTVFKLEYAVVVGVKRTVGANYTCPYSITCFFSISNASVGEQTAITSRPAFDTVSNHTVHKHEARQRHRNSEHRISSSEHPVIAENPVQIASCLSTFPASPVATLQIGKLELAPAAIWLAHLKL